MGGPKNGRLGRGNLRLRKEKIKVKGNVKNYFKKSKI